MKFARVLAVFCLLIIMVSSASAFNGQRKGFVLGGGLGLAPTVRYSLGSADNSEFGGAAHILLGYAWDEYNMIVYESNAAGAEVNNINYGQGFAGPTWYHYFGPQGKSFFTVAGLGFYYFQVEGDDATDPGGGYMIGGGYEFSRHFQVAMYLSGGQTSLNFWPVDIEWGHNNLSIVVSAVAF